MAQDSGVIRLGPARAPVESQEPEEALTDDLELGLSRRGFDYDSFESRLESLWFQRKTFLADGRYADAQRQSQLIRAFCTEEGVRRLENMSGALITEAKRYLEEGHHEKALDSLSLAESFDPERAQIHLARANVYWEAGRGIVSTSGELLAALRTSFFGSIQSLTLFHQLSLLLLLAVMVCLFVFSLLMLVRYQAALRHEIEEWVSHRLDERWSMPVGWLVLVLPLLLWFAAGWIAFYWLLMTFRFMRRSERTAAVVLMIAAILAIPAYRMTVSMYGTTADPVVRTTIASADGEYDPDRIIKLQQLVDAHPEDAVYRFLLAGLFKNGRYFEEAFVEYRSALELDPAMEEAHINVGNIFYMTGQFAEAVANYNRALAVQPNSMLAHFNMHLAQSESFNFKEAEETLRKARIIDPEGLTALLSRVGDQRGRPSVRDATLEMASIWGAALDGRQPWQLETGGEEDGMPARLSSVANPISLVGLGTLLLFGVSFVRSRHGNTARRCIRCGRPFCQYCKTGREGHEYCSQCLHLFVRGDGLAPETKTRKLYEVERFERWTRKARRLVSVFLPGAGLLLRGRAAVGLVLLVLWFAALLAWQPAVLFPVEWLAGLSLRTHLFGAAAVPPTFSMNPFGIVAFVVMLTVWFVGNFWRREKV